jgi:hypothetical protein
MKKITIILCLFISITVNAADNQYDEYFSGSFIVEGRKQTLSTVVGMLTNYVRFNLTPEENNNIGSLIRMTYVPGVGSTCRSKTFSFPISLIMEENIRNMTPDMGIYTVCPDQARIINQAVAYAESCGSGKITPEADGTIVINNNIIIDDMYHRSDNQKTLDYPNNDYSWPELNRQPASIPLLPLTGDLERDVYNIDFQEEKKYKLLFGSFETQSWILNLIEGGVRWFVILGGPYLLYDMISSENNSQSNQIPNPFPGDYNQPRS